jgi:hypothetical protein
LGGMGMGGPDLEEVRRLSTLGKTALMTPP